MDNIIKSIDPGSPLRHHARIGDNLIAINGKRVVDVLDYKLYAYDRRLDVLLRRREGTLHLYFQPLTEPSFVLSALFQEDDARLIERTLYEESLSWVQDVIVIER